MLYNLHLYLADIHYIVRQTEVEKSQKAEFQCETLLCSAVEEDAEAGGTAGGSAIYK